MLVRSTIQNRPDNFIYPKNYDNGERGVFAGGGRHQGQFCGDSRYISISTPGNSTAFGSVDARTAQAGASGRGRGLIIGGQSGDWGSRSTYADIDYVTIATPGNVTNFGNLTASRTHAEGCSNGTRTLSISGRVHSSTQGNYAQNVDYVTIATAGNAADFGDLITPWSSGTYCAEGDGTYAVTLSYQSSNADFLYFNISTLGNATKWGDCRPSGSNYYNPSAEGSVSASDGIRAVYGGGYAGEVSQAIDYITFATPSNGLQFGLWWSGAGWAVYHGSAVNGPSSRAVVLGGGTAMPLKYFNLATAASTSTTHGTTFGTMTNGSADRREAAAGFAGD